MIACGAKSYDKAVEQPEIKQDILDSSCLISADEFVVFWNKFSSVLLANDAKTLNNLIDEKFYSDCFGGLDISEVCKMNFSNDSTIFRNRFCKEFKKSLNPVYLELIKQYEIRKHIEMKPPRTLEDMQSRYFCAKTIGKGNYAIYTDFSQEKVDVRIAYECSYSEYSRDSRGIYLEFCKKNNEIKLCKMTCYNYVVEGHPINLE